MVAVSTPARLRALVADDQPDVRAALELLLKGEGYHVDSVGSPKAVVEALQNGSYDVLLMDLNYSRDTTSGQEGLDLLSRVQAIDSRIPILVMTAWGTVEVAVEAMRRGVRDFVLKPWDNHRLLDMLQTQIEQSRIEQRRQRMQAQKQKLWESELEAAREIQNRLLPARMPAVDGFQIDGLCRSARVIGGDYFDAMDLDDRRIALCIADVSGKGMPAALLMANFQAAVKATIFNTSRPAELCDRVNRVMWHNTAISQFVTFFYAVLDTHTRRLTYANAGHNEPVLLRADGTWSRLSEGGAVLGVFEDGRFDEGEVTLDTGDRVMMFTDGITEASNAAGDEFGEDRLVQLLAERRAMSAPAICRTVMSAIEHYNEERFEDDATLLVLAVA